MKELKCLIIHCADTPPNMKVTAEMIRRWHMNPPPHGRGWSRPGYSDLTRRDGIIENLNEYDEDKWVQNNEITWGAKGFNGVSRHLCLAGGKDENGKSLPTGDFDRMLTPEQFIRLRHYVHEFIINHPECQILGHYAVNDHKTCPGFDVPKFLRFIDVPELYIFNQKKQRL